MCVSTGDTHTHTRVRVVLSEVISVVLFDSV